MPLRPKPLRWPRPPPWPKPNWAEVEVHAWLKDLDARLEVIFAHPEQNLGRDRRTVKPVRSKSPCACWRNGAGPGQSQRRGLPSVPSATANSRSKDGFAAPSTPGFGPLTFWRRLRLLSPLRGVAFSSRPRLGPGPQKPPLRLTCRKSQRCWSARCPPSKRCWSPSRLGLESVPLRAAPGKLTVKGAQSPGVAQPSSSANSTLGSKSSRSPAPAAEGPPTQPFTLVIEI